MNESVEEIIEDVRILKRALQNGGVPVKALGKIERTALRSGRRQTGTFKSNRAPRWRLPPNDPQYGTEKECRKIQAKLLSQLLEFDNSPRVARQVKKVAEKYLSHLPRRGSYRDPLTRERFSFRDFIAEVQAPRHGKSLFHMGHDNPLAMPRHTSGNIAWRMERSNLIQGDLTLSEARARIVELIARYFELGDVRIRGVQKR